jgi:hypothetical protein
MTDRELLELAAKAAGLTLHLLGDDGHEYITSCGYSIGRWYPLNDIGDAMWLVCKFEFKIDWGQFDVVVTHYEGDIVCREKKTDNLAAALSRAIVRAAAEIGKTMGAV